ncbi:hypothetical protein BCR32DRAFT_267591 [Anaeromyces robustus]|uniref:Uncharacterized protein n=1 Tax=Anaeromyces robustus TaxID=1754192 RepID=A0A1Y1X9V5_9FUNG|nr:hypothetical protein BCR32DRAFT_267591 [Anaeromyces robustus]|eukprot:ORX82509.1 hypothetical protein BCR32DRAFT_267591 [Anaeromyces robustus]
MVLSCSSKNIINDAIKLNDKKNGTENNIKNNIETLTYYNDNVNNKQKESNINHISLNVSDKSKNMINNNNLVHNINTNDKLTNIVNNRSKNEKINMLDNKLSTNNSNDISKHNKLIAFDSKGFQNILEKKKLRKNEINVVLNKEKDIKINTNFHQNKGKDIKSFKANVKSINNNINKELVKTPKKLNNKNNGDELIRPIIMKKALFIPTISDEKKNEKLKNTILDTKNNIKNNGISKNNSENDHTLPCHSSSSTFTAITYTTSSNSIHTIPNTTSSNYSLPSSTSSNEARGPLNSFKPSFSNSQAALLANMAFKTKRDMTNKRIVKAITKYKPSIDLPTSPEELIENAFRIYKSAHLDFCRNCLIPKDVLYFQGHLLFKNVSKLKGMNLSRQQINNALEWEVIKYTVFNSKSTDFWIALLNQYKNDRTSTKILSKRYAARKQSQKCVKRETEDFERKYIAYNIIKKKGPIILDYYKSITEDTSVSEIKKNNNENDINNKGTFVTMNSESSRNKVTKPQNMSNNIIKINPNISEINNKSERSMSNLYSDMGSLNDYKRILSKSIEQRVKVTAKNRITKPSPLKESFTIDYSTKIINNKKNKKNSHMISFDINDIKSIKAYIYPIIMTTNNKYYSVNETNEIKIKNNLYNCNILFFNVLKKNQNKNNFNNLISCYLYYILNIFYISIPCMYLNKTNFKGLSLKKSYKIYENLILLLKNNYNNNNNINTFSHFVDTINDINNVKFIHFNKLTTKSNKTRNKNNDKNNSNNNILLKIQEKEKLIIIRYLLYYLLSPKNIIPSLNNQSKKSKIICLIFIPGISSATNKLNTKYLTYDIKYVEYKKYTLKCYNIKSKNSTNSIANKDVIKYVLNKEDLHKNKIIYFFNENNLNGKKLIDTVYPIMNQNFIAIYNHHYTNESNKKLLMPTNNLKLIKYNKNSSDNNNYDIHKKMNFILPELNNFKPLYGYKKFIFNSYITSSTLRQRKNCIISHNDINNDIILSEKHKFSQIENGNL